MMSRIHPPDAAKAEQDQASDTTTTARDRHLHRGVI